MHKFEPNDKVICVESSGYNFTEGKEYTVVDYIPEFDDPDIPSGFTWPAYLDTIDDDSFQVRCHASRFIPKT